MLYRKLNRLQLLFLLAFRVKNSQNGSIDGFAPALHRRKSHQHPILIRGGSYILLYPLMIGMTDHPGLITETVVAVLSLRQCALLPQLAASVSLVFVCRKRNERHPHEKWIIACMLHGSEITGWDLLHSFHLHARIPRHNVIVCRPFGRQDHGVRCWVCGKMMRGFYQLMYYAKRNAVARAKGQRSNAERSIHGSIP